MPLPYSKAIEEGGGSCRHLLLQYKIACNVTKQEEEGDGSHAVAFFVAFRCSVAPQEEEGDGIRFAY